MWNENLKGNRDPASPLLFSISTCTLWGPFCWHTGLLLYGDTNLPLVSQGNKLHDIHTNRPRPQFLYYFFFIKVILQRRSRNITCWNTSYSSLDNSFYPANTFPTALQDPQTLLICINTSNVTPSLSFIAETCFVVLALDFTCHSHSNPVLQPQLPKP